MDNKPGLSKQFQNLIQSVTSILKIILSVTLVVGIAISFIRIPNLLKGIISVPETLSTLINYVALVIIGIELIHVINSDDLESVIEILMMAVTRELVIRELGMMELLIGVVCIAGLFAIKRFFIKKN